MAFSAFLDTCVLVPSRLRDLLLETASRGAYRPLWSNGVEEELARVLKKIGEKRGQTVEEMEIYTKRLFDQMNKTLPDARIQLNDKHFNITVPQLPDPNDAHIIQAAIIGRADVIVTNNLKDFPQETLPHHLFAQSPDDFLTDLIDLHPSMTLQSLETISQRSGKKGKHQTVEDILIQLGKGGLTSFACSAHGLVIGEE